MNTVLPALAVMGIWLFAGGVLAGCGLFVRRAAVRLVSGTPVGGLAAADLWIGLAALLAYLQVWNLFLRIAWFACVPPIALGAAGLVAGRRTLRAKRLASPRSALILALLAVAGLWVANQALAAPGDYDFGLYHLNAIGWAEHYAAIPGLGDLQSRLGAADAHLLFVAFLDHGPWRASAPISPTVSSSRCC